MADFQSRLDLLRYVARELDTEGQPSTFDVHFWRAMDEIEAAGRTCDKGYARRLAELTQLDDIANPADWLLAQAALPVLAEMPQAALAAARDIQARLQDSTSRYRKVGLCKVLEASGLAEAVILVEPFTADPDPYVAREAKLVMNNLLHASDSDNG